MRSVYLMGTAQFWPLLLSQLLALSLKQKFISLVPFTSATQLKLFWGVFDM
jgi:hypothetical protein